MNLAARIVGALAAALWLLPVVGGLIAREPIEEGTATESIAVVTLAIINILAVLLAFRRERLGGMVLVASGLAFSTFAIFSAGRNQAFAAAVSGGPFIISGLLFLFAQSDRRTPS